MSEKIDNSANFDNRIIHNKIEERFQKHLKRFTASEEAVKATNGWAYFINNWKVAILAGLIITISGVMSFVTISKESAPYIAYGIVSVSTSFTGVSAEDIDQLITEKIESKIKNISGVKKISSTSRNSLSSITIEFNPGQDMTKAMSDIRSKVDEAKPQLPADIDSDPYILEIDSSIDPLISVILYGNNYTDFQLRDYAEDLKLFAESIYGVAGVEIIGGAAREIVVELNPYKLMSLNLTVGEVMNSIRNSHRDTPIGDFEIDNVQYNLRIKGKHETAEDIKSIQLKNVKQGDEVMIIKLADVAKVEEAGEDTDRISRFLLKNNGTGEMENAVEISLKKNLGTNIFAVNDSIKEKIEEYAKDYLPSDLKMSFAKVMAEEIDRSYDTVYTNGTQAIFIVMLILVLFVGLRAGFVASMVIPLAFLATIAIFKIMGYSLNFLSNFAMILALGILVDTAIVIVEGVEYYLHKGYSPKDASVMSLNEFKKPLISGALTTLAVFIPLFTLPGVMGQYLSFIPITVFIVLTSSLFISLFLITAYASMLADQNEYDYDRRSKTKIGHFCHCCNNVCHKFRNFFKNIQTKAVSLYGRILDKFLLSRFLRIIVFYIIIVLFFLSNILPIPFVLFPEGDVNFFSVSVEKVVGTTPENVAEFSSQIEKIILNYSEVKMVTTSISKNQATIAVELLDKDDREDLEMRTSMDIVDELQKRFLKVSDATVRVQSASQGPPSEFPVAIRVIAATKDAIPSAQIVAYDIADLLTEIKGAVGVKHDIEMIAGEYLFTIDRKKAIALGVDPDQVATIMRTAVKGTNVATIARDGRDIDIVVKYDPETLIKISDIKNIKILNHQGEYILLNQIVDDQLTESLSTVRRRDGKISFTVSSLLTEDGNAVEVTDALSVKLENYKLPSGVTLEVAGENEENAELMESLLQGMVMAILLMFLILVVQFNSYIQPLLILFTIMFAQIAVNTGLYFSDTVKSLAYMIGVISLAGIVVNDSIIIVDQMNKTIDKGKKNYRNAIVYAAKSRFIPIILTTLTTSAGILPLVWTDVFWRGLSLTIIFGLSFASILTLFVTPALYWQCEREKVLTFVPLIVLLCLGIAYNQLADLLQGDWQSGMIIVALAGVIYLLLSWVKHSYNIVKHADIVDKVHE